MDDETRCWLNDSLPASDQGSVAVCDSKWINPRPQSCLCLAWSGYPSNDDEDDVHLTLALATPAFTTIRFWRRHFFVPASKIILFCDSYRLLFKCVTGISSSNLLLGVKRFRTLRQVAAAKRNGSVSIILKPWMSLW